MAAILWLAGAMAGTAAEWRKLPDPTRPYSVAEFAVAGPAKGELVLQSTRISPTARRATINGRTYKIGDRVDGAVIKDIQPYEVNLRRGTQETQLRLLPRLVKEPKNVPGKNPGHDG